MSENRRPITMAGVEFRHLAENRWTTTVENDKGFRIQIWVNLDNAKVAIACHPDYIPFDLMERVAETLLTAVAFAENGEP